MGKENNPIMRWISTHFGPRNGKTPSVQPAASQAQYVLAMDGFVVKSHNAYFRFRQPFEEARLEEEPKWTEESLRGAFDEEHELIRVWDTFREVAHQGNSYLLLRTQPEMLLATIYTPPSAPDATGTLEVITTGLSRQSEETPRTLHRWLTPYGMPRDESPQEPPSLVLAQRVANKAMHDLSIDENHRRFRGGPRLTHSDIPLLTYLLDK